MTSVRLDPEATSSNHWIVSHQGLYHSWVYLMQCAKQSLPQATDEERKWVCLELITQTSREFVTSQSATPINLLVLTFSVGITDEVYGGTDMVGGILAIAAGMITGNLTESRKGFLI